MRRPLDPPLRIRVGSWTAESTTRFERVSAYPVAVSTTAFFGVDSAELHSVYLGHELAGTEVCELRLAPRGPRHTVTRSYTHTELPVSLEPRRCLYDHLQRLQELIADAVDESVAIDGL